MNGRRLATPGAVLFVVGVVLMWWGSRVFRGDGSPTAGYGGSFSGGGFSGGSSSGGGGGSGSFGPQQPTSSATTPRRL